MDGLLLIKEMMEYTSLQNLNEKKGHVAPFPVENDVKIRENSGNHFANNHRSQTIHFGQTSAEAEDPPLIISGITKINYDGIVRKISKNQSIKIDQGNMYLINDKGESELLRNEVTISRPRPINKKEIQITNTTRYECKLYRLYFDSSKDANVVSAELNNYVSTRNGKSLKERQMCSYMEKVSQDPSPNEERVQITHRLLKLLRRRSSKDTLEKKGIIKNETIFGNSLNNLFMNDGRPVPQFVEKVIDIIEQPKNITSMGLYRASGNLATIQKVRLQIDRKNLKILDDYKNDIDVLTGALKLFFRELKEPVITHKTYTDLLKFLEKDLDLDSISNITNVINKMNEPHKRTFLLLLKHLVKVENYKESNKMDACNISIVWGPTLIWPPENSVENVLQNHTNANKIIEMLLNAYKGDFLQESSQMTSRIITDKTDTISSFYEKSKKLTKKDSPEIKSATKSKFGSMENLFKAFISDSPPKDSKWNLEVICKNCKEKIPEFLLRAIPIIEKSNRKENVYAVQPYTADKLEKIKLKVSKNKFGSLEKSDIYELTSSVQIFFSELDPPLIPEVVFLKMIRAIEGIENEMEKFHFIKLELNKLNLYHYETLNFLFKHLSKICRENKFNLMTGRRMALAWTEVLSRKILESNDSSIYDPCTNVIEYLIKYFDENSSVDVINDLKTNLIIYNQNYENPGKASVKNTFCSSNNNSCNSNENSVEKEKRNDNANNLTEDPSKSVKKRTVKNISTLHRISKYYDYHHPSSIYDNVPSTHLHIKREEVRNEAKLLETDANQNVKKHFERTTKL